MYHEGQPPSSAPLQHPHEPHRVVAMAVAQNDGAEVGAGHLEDVCVVDQAVRGESGVEEERLARAILQHRHEHGEAMFGPEAALRAAHHGVPRRPPHPLGRGQQRVDRVVDQRRQLDAVDGDELHWRIQHRVTPLRRLG
jgi:hypothetical protein